MSRSTLNFCVDAALTVLLLTALGVFAVVHFVFPAGTAAAGWVVWGLDYDTWCDVQVVAVSAFALGVLLHLILHWKWVCGYVAERLSRGLGRKVVMNDSARTLYGVSLLIAVLTLLGALLTAAEFSAVDRPATPPPIENAPSPGPVQTIPARP